MRLGHSASGALEKKGIRTLSSTPSTSIFSALMYVTPSCLRTSSSGRHSTQTLSARSCSLRGRVRVPPLSRSLTSTTTRPSLSPSANAITRIGTLGLAATLKRNRLKFLGSGSIAIIFAFRVAYDATKSENKPTFAPISTKTKVRPERLALSISETNSARSAASYMCGVNSRFFCSAGAIAYEGPSVQRQDRDRHQAAS